MRADVKRCREIASTLFAREYRELFLVMLDIVEEIDKKMNACADKVGASDRCVGGSCTEATKPEVSLTS